MRIDSASCHGSRLASACLGGQMRSFTAKCDLPPHTDAASTADSASTRCTLPPRIAKYVCSALTVLYHQTICIRPYVSENMYQILRIRPYASDPMPQILCLRSSV
ncbi:hypothetical protein DPMN_068152 [Dreissena polymorpha]|uniref:Uncharacterized protein n=1 Tax=Dreissena polymorpha TaxID=45954 RepID=A0A9D4BTZ9_DREPO|nr:hypothetical protein DPMN_068152 [Dreissena polymorpha]